MCVPASPSLFRRRGLGTSCYCFLFYDIYTYIFFPTFGAVTVAITIFNSIYLFALAGKKNEESEKEGALFSLLTRKVN